MFEPRKSRAIAAIGGLVVFGLYVAGIFVRQSYGIGVIVRNQSAVVLRDVSVTVERRGQRYPLPDLGPGQSKRVYVHPVGESDIVLEFTDGSGKRHSEMLAGYVENDYCGRTTAVVYPDRTDIHDDTFGILYWKSWLDFFL